MDTVYAEMANIRELLNEYGTTNNKRLLKDIALKHQTINDILTVVRSIKYPIHEVVQETVYDRVDDDENFIDESKAPKKTMNVLKQYPYSFDDVFNPNLDLLKVLKYEK
jgi:signal recognition particle subunit SEC65